LFINENRLSDIKQKPGKEVFIWLEESKIFKSKIKHFIDFENSKVIIKPLTGFIAGKKYMGTCVPH